MIRASEGTLRAVKNLCIGSLIEAVRDQTKTVDLRQVNAVLMQPHWRHNTQSEPAQPLIHSNQSPTKARNSQLKIYTIFGKTEAGSAGTQPRQGIAKAETTNALMIQRAWLASSRAMPSTVS
jgi:hypothetical protein